MPNWRLCEGPLVTKLECTFRTKEVSRVWERDVMGIIQVEKIGGGETVVYV